MKWTDVALRMGACLLALAAIDLAIRAVFPPVADTTPWRMPRALPTSQIDVAAAALGAAEPARKVAFIGGSPAWGDAVETAEAVPARLESMLQQRTRSERVRVVNMACNGQLAADSYTLASYAAEHDADLVIVQVTYHNFSPAGRDGSTARYPELAEMLGVRIGPEAAGVLGREPTPQPDVSGAIERWLREHWYLYGQRERIAADLLKASPEQRLYSGWNEVVNGYSTLETVDEDQGTPFPELDPGMQSMMADEWAMDTEFEVSADDSEIVMLRMLCSDLAEKGTPVLVYLSPVNTEALNEFGMFDAARFRENVAAIKAAVEGAGGVFVDLNEPDALPMESFADINHTTAEGCERTAERLVRVPAIEGLIGR